MQNDVDKIHDYIALDNPKAAARWVRQFFRLSRSLKTLPFRYEVIPEAAEFKREIRHVLFGNYRIFYLVEKQVVTILRVIHAARLLRRHYLGETPSEDESAPSAPEL